MDSAFKIVLVGDAGVGKTTYVKRLLGDDFKMPYTATFGSKRHLVHFNASYGNVIFNVWDTAGQEKFSGVRENYYKNADAAIVMYDVNSLISYKNVQWWCDEIRTVNPDLPIVIVGNKCDIVGGRKVENGSYFEISAKLKTFIYDPLYYIAEVLI